MDAHQHTRTENVLQAWRPMEAQEHKRGQPSKERTSAGRQSVSAHESRASPTICRDICRLCASNDPTPLIGFTAAEWTHISRVESNCRRRTNYMQETWNHEDPVQEDTAQKRRYTAQEQSEGLAADQIARA